MESWKLIPLLEMLNSAQKVETLDMNCESQNVFCRLPPAIARSLYISCLFLGYSVAIWLYFFDHVFYVIVMIANVIRSISDQQIFRLAVNATDDWPGDLVQHDGLQGKFLSKFPACATKNSSLRMAITTDPGTQSYLL
jgi:hypothetical protein